MEVSQKIKKDESASTRVAGATAAATKNRPDWASRVVVWYSLQATCITHSFIREPCMLFAPLILARFMPHSPIIKWESFRKERRLGSAVGQKSFGIEIKFTNAEGEREWRGGSGKQKACYTLKV